MASPPGRRTKEAESDRRNSWYGLGTYASVEKDAFGRFLDDVAYAFADVSAFAVPALAAVASSIDGRRFGLEATALVAWLTMALGAALLRGGWIRPLGTPVRGWVDWSPSMLLLRLGYYNAALTVTTGGGVALAELSGRPTVAGGFALAVGGIAIAAFPWTAEVVAGAVADRWPSGVPGEYRL